ncbi:hypothetical protein KR032_001430 [Drosophila birchii]|nr:hypothetical protein KR032_001430 [Drosophila birchii]
MQVVQDILLVIALIGLCSFPLTAACSRAIDKNRPTELTTRPNVTFPTYPCPPPYDAEYCLNGAKCFAVVLVNEVQYNCECALGFWGHKCENKEVDGSYLTKNGAMRGKASIGSGATLALLFMAMCI